VAIKKSAEASIIEMAIFSFLH
jgi:hypothetical protein